MTPCPFCRILAGELASSLVLEDALVVAILDIRPANPGHTLVMPRRHVEFFTDLTQTEVEFLTLAGQRVATARPSLVSIARNTSPIPPLPSSARIW